MNHNYIKYVAMVGFILLSTFFQLMETSAAEYTNSTSGQSNVSISIKNITEIDEGEQVSPGEGPRDNQAGKGLGNLPRTGILSNTKGATILGILLFMSVCRFWKSYSKRTRKTIGGNNQ